MYFCCPNTIILRVVHVIEALGGGVYTYFKDLSFFFGENGPADDLETYIIYSGNRKEIDPSKITEDFSKNVKLIEVPMVREFSIFKDLKSVLKLRKVLKEINPDAIHLHSSKAGVLGRAAHFLLFDKKKLFYTPHGYSFLRVDISPLHKKIYQAIEKYSQLIFGGTTIACGDTEYEIAKQLGKSVLVRNGISINELQRFYNPVLNPVMRIGIVGRITAQKDPELFNRIATLFPQFQFVWIGDGDLRSLLTAPNIIVTGWFLNQNDIMKELNTLDIYLQTSLWEGLPIAVLEGMALRKPVVATNVIGNKDIVIPNETGFLFDSTAELENYFEELKELQKRILLGNNGFHRCEQVFDKDKNFRKLVSIYKH